MKLTTNYWHKMNFIKDMDISNKRVLIRVDYNVPIQNGKISNDFRIRQSLETINYCISNNASVVSMYSTLVLGFEFLAQGYYRRSK